jgi:AraC family transcriptional regulator, regulatory protein of adaptative response / DNA-3-methyladenine glycosylase II
LCGSALPEAGDPALAAVTHVFPLPECIARIDDLGLALGMPRARAAAIVGLAKVAAADPSIFEPGRGLDEVIQRLRTLPGIGEWTAQYIAMRALREPDAFPAADIGLMRAMATADGRPTSAQLLAHADAWRPWRAYAALHLWASHAAVPSLPSLAGGKLHATVQRTRPVADRHDSPGL